MGCLCEELAGKGVEVSPTCIGQLWVFANLQHQEILAVVKSALRRRLSRGQYVFMQGDASSEISLIKAGRVKLSKLMEDGSEIILNTRINWLTNRIGSMSLTKLDDRLHRVLMNVAREHGVKGAEGFTIQFPLTHEDLSFLTGAHRVSITRAMKSLKEAGKIIQHGRTLTLPLEAEWI